MGYRKRTGRSPGDNPPGETRRRKRAGPLGATSPTAHGTNPKAAKAYREWERKDRKANP